MEDNGQCCRISIRRRTEPAAHIQFSIYIPVRGQNNTSLSYSTWDVLEVHHVRACQWVTTDQRSITSPCKHPVCAAWAARSHRRSLCFLKRSIDRLAHADLIMTVTEDRDIHQHWWRENRNLTNGNVCSIAEEKTELLRVKENTLTPKVAWEEKKRGGKWRERLWDYDMKQ